MAPTYDALLVVSFGGPEGLDDVIPFLENVLRGRNVPRERMLEVAEHYKEFDGKSPINDQNRALIAALDAELAAHGPKLPIYWGNRNWHPMLPDTLWQMAADGIRRALVFLTSAYSSYSSCRQYRENLADAQTQVGDAAPELDRLRLCFNHPGFIEPNAESVGNALAQIPADRRATTQIVFTAHSIPTAMADNCLYEQQLLEASRLVSKTVQHDNWRLVYQSRSGPPQQPWLEPDICAYLAELHAQGEITDVVVLPIGFISDHLEVLYDLDTEAQQLCDELGLNMVRAATVGTHPRFVRMIRELIVERMGESPERVTVGTMPPNPDICAADCCQYSPQRPAGA